MMNCAALMDATWGAFVTRRLMVMTESLARDGYENEKGLVDLRGMVCK